MALLIGLGDYGIGDYIQRVDDLYNLLLDLCQDQLAWENILNKPTTLTGYGITDAYTQAQILTILEGYALQNHTHSYSSLTEKPTLIGDAGITDVYTKQETDGLLDEKSDVDHTHTLADISDIQDVFDLLGFDITTTLPANPEPRSLHFVRPSGETKATIYLIDPAGNPVEMNYVSYAIFASALAGKQNKLTGNTNQLVLGDGTFIARDKNAVGLGNVANIPPSEYPISDAQATVNIQKANDVDVLHKSGNETKTGILTFAQSPEVPTASESQQAVNLGQVNSLIQTETSGKSFVTLFGNGTDSLYTITHSLGTKAIVPSFFNLLTGKVVHLGASFPDDDTIVVTTSKPAAIDKYQLTLVRQW